MKGMIALRQFSPPACPSCPSWWAQSERIRSAGTGILFLYKDVLGKDPGWLDDVVRAKRPQRLPVVLTRPEVEALLSALDGVSWIMAMLLYGSGLRLMECLRLRVKDVEFTRHEILVREGKGNKDRVTMLPGAVEDPLRVHLDRVRVVHERDLKSGFGRVQLPDALARKYPNAHREWSWQSVFPHHGSSKMRASVCRSDFISTSRYSNAPFTMPHGRLALPSRSARTP